MAIKLNGYWIEWVSNRIIIESNHYQIESLSNQMVLEKNSFDSYQMNGNAIRIW